MGNQLSIEERLERAHKTGILTLTGANLKKLPDLLREAICSKPSTLAPLIKSIDFSQNKIPEFPREILNFTNLKHLKLSSNIISGQLDFDFEFLKLETLDVSFNRISAFRISRASNLPAIKHIKLNNNRITSLDYIDFTQITSLKLLNLSGNSIKQLPESISALSNMEELALANNGLSNLGKYMGELKSLKKLDIRGNNVDTIPSSLFLDTELKFLQLSGNPIKPGQLFDIDGYEDFIQRRKGRIDQLLK